jgi:excisionase family DNA binding protein
MRTISGPEWMQPRQAAEALGIEVSTLARWRKAGKITATRTHTGRYEYARAEVERVLNGGAK